MKYMKKYKALLVSIVLGTLLAQPVLAEQVSAEDLVSSWNFYGKGLRKVERNMFYMKETHGSSGVMIVSTEAYSENFVLTYEVMPMTSASVLVVLMSASDHGKGKSLTLPDDYDGNAGPWVREIDNYFFAYNNASHNVTPFINKFPDTGRLAEYPENILEVGKFAKVEIRRSGSKLSVSVNGNVILETVDPEPLGPGHLAFRIRGLSEEPAACLIRNVVIESR